mmetsp:Transcript_19862/g.42983  ORF Transcript_19862/g.42983 Transcript_19862/m.42983 type:complete len:188 (+) Transcript_19862:160-723(+)
MKQLTDDTAEATESATLTKRGEFHWKWPQPAPRGPKKPPPLQLKIERIQLEAEVARQKLLDPGTAQRWIERFEQQEDERLERLDRKMEEKELYWQRIDEDMKQKAVAARKLRHSQGRPPPSEWGAIIKDKRERVTERYLREEEQRIADEAAEYRMQRMTSSARMKRTTAAKRSPRPATMHPSFRPNG